MALQNVQDLFPYVRVMEVVPVGPTTRLSPPELAERSEPLPEGCGLVDAGYRLDAWRDQARAWPKDDVLAMEAFIRERVEPHLRSLWAAVEQAQQRLLDSQNLLAKLNAWFWKEGIHYHQDEEFRTGIH